MAKTSKKAVQEFQQVVNKVVEPVVELDPVVQPEPEVQDDKLEPRKSEFEQLITRLEQAQSELKTLKSDLSRFYNLVTKDFKKANKGRRRINRERSPTGFGKAGVVPEGLRTLLGISENEHMTRPDVTNKLYSYLDEHKLRDEDDKRIMRADASVAKAFGLTVEQVKSINSYKKDENGKVEKNKGLNFYNIQKYVASIYKGKPIEFETTEDVSSGEETQEEKVAEQVIEPQPKAKGRGKSKVNVV